MGVREGEMATVHDVAAYILRKQGPMSAMKLQKLVYYAQAWHLVWTESLLFEEPIYAWANGPVVKDLYVQHRGKFTVGVWPWGDPDKLSVKEKMSVDAVLDFYGDKSAHWLSELSHREAPWRYAREGLGAGERGSQEITQSSMFEYYDGLTTAGK
jgi:uncharacterized phage-associated protein